MAPRVASAALNTDSGIEEKGEGKSITCYTRVRHNVDLATVYFFLTHQTKYFIRTLLSYFTISLRGGYPGYGLLCCKPVPSFA